MSLSSLPTELLREIIESTVPSTFHSSTYKSRQSTLCSLCLVCRKFCQIAQPRLFEIVFASNRLETLSEAVNVAGSKRWKSIIREAIIDVDWGANFSLAGLAQVGEGLRALALGTLSEKWTLPNLQLLPSMIICLSSLFATVLTYLLIIRRSR